MSPVKVPLSARFSPNRKRTTQTWFLFPWVSDPMCKNNDMTRTLQTQEEKLKLLYMLFPFVNNFGDKEDILYTINECLPITIKNF